MPYDPKDAFERAQKDSTLEFAFSELAGYVENGVLYEIFEWAYEDGFEEGEFNI